ncbi:MAG: CotH kinase family protein [Bacteroidales bacterium]|nr:CotH kinase family protein [Bacteroidales bacterium]
MKKIISAAALAIMASAADAQIVINEFCTTSDTLEYHGYVSDWVEVYNAGSESVNLKGYGLSDNPKKPGKHTIDCDAVVSAGGYAVLLCNGIGSGLNASFKLSGDGGEEIVLSDPSGEIIDRVTTPALHEDFSYGRTTDGGSVWGIFDVATPGKRNSRSLAFSATPSISPAAGFYKGTQKITITCSDPSATIYYTTNGSEPTTSSWRYTAPISIGKNTAIRAIAVSDGHKASPVATSTYFINERKMTLPVISLVTDNKNFYDNKIGIYVEGKNGVAGKCSDKPVNWNQDWERPVHFEYFDKDLKLQVSQDAGVKITGTCSRTNSMKSLRIIARKEYGDNRLRYKFFDKKDIKEFKSIVLRNGGNDFSGTMLRDALITGLAASGSMDVEVQALQPAAVFLNGEYLGMHNIREKVSDHFIEENYGVESDLVDLLEYKGDNSSYETHAGIIDGDNKEFDEMMKFVKDNKFDNQENYNKLAEQMDIDNFIDYWIAQIYVDNEDWPMNNIKWWKVRGTDNKSKWRWILFGTEFSCGVYGGQPDVNSVWRDIDVNSNGWSTTTWSTRLMRRLLENEGFKAKFLQRFSYHIEHTFRYERVKEFSDSLKNLVSEEFMEHGMRWYDWLVQSWWGGPSNWDNNVNNLNKWFERRPNHIVKHLQDYFGLSGRFNVIVSAEDCDKAKFSVNGCPSTAKISGYYFADVTLNLSAVLPSDKEVDYWIVTDSNGDEKRIFADAIDLTLTDNVTVTLHVKDAAPVVLPERTVATTGLYVNEVMPHNKGALCDETGHYPKAWIEFYNDNDFAIDMAGLYVMNEKVNYQIPGGSSELTTIPAKGHLVFFADGKTELGALHLGLTLKDDKANAVYLGEIIDGNASYIDYYEMPALKKNQSYGRSSDGAEKLVTFENSTPFAKNSMGKVLVEQTLYTYVEEGPDPYVPDDPNPGDDDPTPVSEVVSPVASVNVYPNPTSDYVKINGNSEEFKYILCSISGKQLLTGVGKEVDMSGLPAGMYVLQVFDGDVLQGVKVMKR